MQLFMICLDSNRYWAKYVLFATIIVYSCWDTESMSQTGPEIPKSSRSRRSRHVKTLSDWSIPQLVLILDQEENSCTVDIPQRFATFGRISNWMYMLKVKYMMEDVLIGQSVHNAWILLYLAN